jgi:hypothetical protein
MWDALWQYYGLDWIAAAFSLASVYRLGDNRRDGFTLGVAGSILWVIFSVMAHTIPGALLNIVGSGLYLRGFLKWKPRDPISPGSTGVQES